MLILSFQYITISVPMFIINITNKQRNKLIFITYILCKNYSCNIFRYLLTYLLNINNNNIRCGYAPKCKNFLCSISFVIKSCTII